MATTAERLPQFHDRVEAVRSHTFGTVELVDLDQPEPEFFVRLDSGFGGWFTAPELRVCGGAPASDPANYC